MHIRLKLVVTSLLLLQVFRASSQQVIQLYQGAAPGSENWNWQEKDYFSPIFNTEIVYNVVHPSMAVFKPDSMPSNGTAVVICPGGGFITLSINSEGNDVAKWLTKRGVTCFVLRYRLVHALTDDPVKEMMSGLSDPKKFDSMTSKVIPLGISDARNAIAWVRAHAGDYGIDKNKIGIVGFSAGGTMAESTVFEYTPENRPDFVGPIYAYVPPQQKLDVPKDAPPMFLAAASDDQLHLVPSSLLLYNTWQGAGKSVELHLYARGGHGFGMRVQHLNSDTWIDRFGDWLGQLGYLKK
ncbi:MAG TPA: alpha/beta hydrolase [Puia sp.]|nr:alpha/beta hydrolase [Puia sp.]